jgi:hypothetical protein
MRRRLLILSCSATKRWNAYPLPAVDVYDGPVWRTFRQHRGHEAARGITVLALSAEHGLIGHRHRIAHYDRRMDAARAAQLAPWVSESLRELRLEEGMYDEALIVAGKTYLGALELGLVPARTVRVAAGGIGLKRQELRRWLEGVTVNA